MIAASRFVRKKLAQLPKKYARLNVTNSAILEKLPGVISNASIIERQFLEFIETPADKNYKSY